MRYIIAGAIVAAALAGAAVGYAVGGDEAPRIPATIMLPSDTSPTGYAPFDPDGMELDPKKNPYAPGGKFGPPKP